MKPLIDGIMTAFQYDLRLKSSASQIPSEAEWWNRKKY